MATALLPIDGGTVTRYAVVFGLFPGESSFYTVVERDADVGGVPAGNPVVVAWLPPGQRYYVEEHNASQGFLNYRFRHAGFNFGFGEPTSWYRAKPVEWDGQLPPIPKIPPLDLDLAIRTAQTLGLLNVTPENITSLPGYSFQRNSIATYIDANGLVKQAAAHEIRNQHHVDGRRAILIEQLSVNRSLRSQDFSSNWTANGTASITPNADVAPDGTMTAGRLTNTDPEAAGEWLSHTVDGGTAYPSLTFTASMWFKAGNASNIGKMIRMQLARNTGTAVNAILSVILTDEWVRHDVQLTTLADTVGLKTPLQAGNGAVGENADNVLIWGSQVEQKPFPTSYIPTTTSPVTRVDENLSLDFTHVPQEMSIFTDMVTETGGTPNQSHWSISDALADPHLRLRLDAGTSLRVHHDAGANVDLTDDVGTAVPVRGDRLESVAKLSAAGTPSIEMSINQGSPVSATDSTPTATLQGAWGETTLYLGGHGPYDSSRSVMAFHNLLVVAGTQSLAAMRSLAGSVGSVDILIRGDRQVKSIKWAFSTTTYPTSPTNVVNADANGDVTVANAFTLAKGDTGFVTVEFYSQADGVGILLGTLRQSIAHVDEVILAETIGPLAPTANKQNESGTGQTLTKNPQETAAVEDGDAIAFSGFDAPPISKSLDYGIVYQPTAGKWTGTFSSTAPQIMFHRLVNVTTTGADVHAELQQPAGSLVARTHQFPGVGSKGTGASGGSFSAVATQNSGALSNLPAHNDQFTIRYRTKAINNDSVTLTLRVIARLYTKDGATGTYIKRDERSVDFGLAAGASREDDWAKTVNAVDLNGGSNDEVRVECTVINIGAPNTGFDFTAEVWGENVTDPPGLNGIEWQTATSGATTPMTDAALAIYAKFALLDGA